MAQLFPLETTVLRPLKAQFLRLFVSQTLPPYNVLVGPAPDAILGCSGNRRSLSGGQDPVTTNKYVSAGESLCHSQV